MNVSAKPLPLEQWLEQPAAQANLKKIARTVASAVCAGSLHPGFLDSYAPGAAVNDALVDEIQSLLTLFLLERQSKLRGAYQADPARFHAYLKTAFLNHWRDKTRVKDNDLSGYFHHRLGDVLRQSPAFHTRAKPKQPFCYTLNPRGVAIPRLTTEDMEAIPFPAEMVQTRDYEAIKSAETIRALAAYFWKRVVALWQGQPVWAAIDDLALWVERYIPLNGPARALSRAHEAVDPETLAGPNSFSDEIDLEPDEINQWARNFVNRLTPKEQKAFYLKWSRDWRLEQIAQSLGYQSASGAHHAIAKSQDKLRAFVVTLPGLSPPDLNRQALTLFFETVLSILKNERLTP